MRPDNSLFGPKKFPVIISREFGRKSLNMSRISPPETKKIEEIENFPCKFPC